MASVEKRTVLPKQAIMMARLPQEVMTHLLGFSSLPDRVQLASCNTLLDKLVCKDCKELWTKLDLFKQESLTDDMLKALLMRVNAHQVTKSLDIRHCSNVSGAGLTPLSDSKVFEMLYMHGIENRLDTEAIVPVLRTMLPFKLFHVGVKKDRSPDEMKNFLRDLHLSRFEQAYKKRIKCAGSNCGECIVDWDARNWLCENGRSPDTTLQCAECTRHFCFDPFHYNSCSHDCVQCGERGCKDCKNVKCCHWCFKTLCGKCDENFVTCTKCSQDFCRDCDWVGAIFYCDKCGKTVCDSCRDGLIDYCSGCDTWYCKDCKRDIDMCVSCHETCCNGCNAGYVACDHCNRCYFSCNECHSTVDGLCAQCRKAVCASCKDDLLDWCEGCETWYCNECKKEMEECYSCCVTFCDDCDADYVSCSQCKSYYYSCKQCHSKLDGLCIECSEKPRKKAKIGTSESD